MNSSNGFVSRQVSIGQPVLEANSLDEWNAETVDQMLKREEQQLHERLGRIEALRVALGTKVLAMKREDLGELARAL